MSEIEGFRKLLQDLVTPDLKSLQVQVANLEKSTQTAISSLEKSNQAAIQSLEKSSQAAATSFRENIETRFDGQSKLLAEQLKNQQLSISAALEPKLGAILSAIEKLDTRLSYFESRFPSERNRPVYSEYRGNPVQTEALSFYSHLPDAFKQEIDNLLSSKLSGSGGVEK